MHQVGHYPETRCHKPQHQDLNSRVYSLFKGTLKEGKWEKGSESFAVETDILFLELFSIACASRTMPVYSEVPLLVQNTRIA
jgi:hypothetical protein